VCIADNSFALLANIKLFPGQYSQSRQERILNCRLSRAHRIKENVFCILSARFWVFLKPISLSPAKDKIVTSIAFTHIIFYAKMLLQGMQIHPWGHLILQKHKMEH